MKLDRNNGIGKYAVINMRNIKAAMESGETGVRNAIAVLEHHGLINYGPPGNENEFFVIMLKDAHADAALATYATLASADDPEYGADVLELARRSGTNSPFCKMPD